ncbi:holo-ACP synthase [Kutzneria kofuensis]|uniref:Holo-[acyl-carrier protein] synthase n=1 Tax=Kutzneria kofuensis TaxID=103725 RepID=A0A7W9NLS9_9PSEU|nr:holo-ACP synthase [Kutzneria kofuensis]MBB5896811.1 holo-[acyl-carrier protein] synthase [Kutzneria kofuensis]
MLRTELVDVARLSRALTRTPRLASRLFTEAERRGPDGRPRGTASLAARWAAKRAAVLLLDGDPARLPSCEVLTGEGGQPLLRVPGTSGIRWHVSLSHQSGTAVASVWAEPVTGPSTSYRSPSSTG